MDSIAKLKAAVPPNVAEVCARLAEAGHQAVTVGGAVRDTLLGREPGDWDVATSAHPDQVLKLFRHTIPTGIQHGTVTIVTGKGIESHVEVTTYRGEGAYTDARRPDSVIFGVPLREDLARRDLTVNAIAYDVAGEAMFDPFGGIPDLLAKQLKAVGVAVDRFTEDGLRVMRVARFASQLGFDVEPDTKAAIRPALPSLAKVSKERVSDELRKLLGGVAPAKGLAICQDTGIFETILPGQELDIHRPPLVPEELRLASLVSRIPGDKHLRDELKRLKFSNAEVEFAVAIVRANNMLQGASDLPDTRRVMGFLGREKSLSLADFVEDASQRTRILSCIDNPLTLKDLAVGGADLMALGISGKAIGDTLAKLLEKVYDDPALNTKAQLLALVAA
ncbi:MAG: hypothetical protein QM831_44570 [Kofleriaceae bacterium]